jgi:phage shock protein B
MEGVLALSIPILALLIALVGLIFHYVTKWKTAPTLTRDDEAMLDELYQLARRLDARMDTVERLVAADNPAFQPARVVPDLEVDNQQLDEIERMRTNKERTRR